MSSHVLSAAAKTRGPIITSWTWRRVRLTLTFREQDIGPLYVEHSSTRQRVQLTVLPSGSSAGTVAVDVAQIDAGLPLPTGMWRLFAGDAADEAEWPEDPDAPEPPRAGSPVAVDPSAGVDPAAPSGLFSGRGARYWMVPRADGPDRQVVLDVSYRPKQKGAVSLGTRLARLPGRILQGTRNALYVGAYRTARTLVPRNGRRILFTSDSRAEISGNLLHIHRRMCERELDQTYKLRMIFKPSIKAKRSLIDKIRFPFYLGTSDVVLVDDFQPMVYKVPFPEDVKVIQVWHASGAFKTVGYSRLGKPGGPHPFSRGHRMYTHAIVSSAHDVPYYAEAFGINEELVHPTGIPRMDMFFDEAAKETARERAYEAIPFARGRKTVLFAPTFRGNGPADAYYDYHLLDLDALYELAEEQDAVVIFKMHPFIVEPIQLPPGTEDRFIDATELREVNDLLLISDLVITDYSSLVFEYSVLQRPMLFFAYDLEEYEATRDFYEPLVEFAPGKIVRTFDELLTAMRAGDYEEYKVAEFAETHFDHHDAGSSDRVIDDLILG